MLAIEVPEEPRAPETVRYHVLLIMQNFSFPFLGYQHSFSISCHNVCQICTDIPKVRTVL